MPPLLTMKTVWRDVTYSHFRFPTPTSLCVGHPRHLGDPHPILSRDKVFYYNLRPRTESPTAIGLIDTRFAQLINADHDADLKILTRIPLSQADMCALYWLPISFWPSRPLLPFPARPTPVDKQSAPSSQSKVQSICKGWFRRSSPT